MYVQLLTGKTIEVCGVSKQYYPGDYVNIGAHDAARWVAAGEARIWDQRQLAELTAGCGVVVTSAEGDGARLCEQRGYAAQIGEPTTIPYNKTLFWHPSLTPQYHLWPVGFHLLDTWELVVPVWDYDILARDVGTPLDRAQTQAVIHDMRCLLYDPRLVFARQCEAAQRLLDRWQMERRGGGDEKLTFLRALYATPLLVCYLPATWVGKHVE